MFMGWLGFAPAARSTRKLPMAFFSTAALRSFADESGV